MASEIVDALERWRAQGLITDELAGRLAAETEAHERERGTRTFQYALAGSAAVIVLVAGGVFLSLAWPALSDAVRTAVMVVAGAAMLLVGKGAEGRSHLRPVGYLAQAAGLGLLLFAYIYSDQAWSDPGPMRWLVAAAAFVTPVASTFLSLGSGPVMPGINAAFGYAFLLVALDRIGIDAETGLWVADAAMLLALVVLARRLVSAPADANREAELSAFLASLFVGFPLVGFTAAASLDLGGDAVFALDAWWSVTVAVTLWAVHLAPPHLRRPAFQRILGLSVLLAIGLSAWTLDALGVDDDLLALGPALVGAKALVYALRTGEHGVLAAGCVALVIAAWWFGVANGQALGAVVALVFTAAVLFWLAARLGRRGAESAEAGLA